MMEHSKLPWSLLSYPVVGQEEDSCNIRTPDSHWNVADSLTLENGLFIVTACNQHDTLQATIEELSDLLLRAITIEKSADCEYCLENSQCPYNSADECIRAKSIPLLKKAMELK